MFYRFRWFRIKSLLGVLPSSSEIEAVLTSSAASAISVSDHIETLSDFRYGFQSVIQVPQQTRKGSYVIKKLKTYSELGFSVLHHPSGAAIRVENAGRGLGNLFDEVEDVLGEKVTAEPYRFSRMDVEFLASSFSVRKLTGIRSGPMAVAPGVLAKIEAFSKQ